MVRTITKEEPKSRTDRGERLRLVNVRDTTNFKQEQIVSAIDLLIVELSPEKAGFMFARHDLIVTYSLEEDCPAKRIAAQRLLDYGFTNVLAYEGSWREGKGAGDFRKILRIDDSRQAELCGREVFGFLVDKELLSPVLAGRLLSYYGCEFFVAQAV